MLAHLGGEPWRKVLINFAKAPSFATSSLKGKVTRGIFH